MFDVDKTKIAAPDATAVPSFDDLKSNFVDQIVAELEVSNPTLAEAIRTTLNNPAEFGTVIVEGAVRVLQDRYRYVNDQALQMLAVWARGSNLDAKLADRGLERNVIDAGDASAYPPVSPTYESDEAALQRYMLWPYSLATTGTRLGYRFHSLTLGERPKMSVDKPSPTQVVVTYTLSDSGASALVKDASVRSRGGRDGTVDVYVLSYESDSGEASSDTLGKVLAYLNRDDIAQETDLIYIHSAEIVDYQLDITLYGSTRPGGTISESEALQTLQSYAADRHKLNSRISVSNVYAICDSVPGVARSVINLSEDIVCDHRQAPHCSAINVAVIYE
ncbi:MAG: baseplate J/gp47 family protein [Vibrio sp.]